MSKEGVFLTVTGTKGVAEVRIGKVHRILREEDSSDENSLLRLYEWLREAHKVIRGEEDASNECPFCLSTTFLEKDGVKSEQPTIITLVTMISYLEIP